MYYIKNQVKYNSEEMTYGKKMFNFRKRPLAGNNVSHAHNKSRTRQLPNIKTKRLFVPELNRVVRIKLSTSSLRTIDKIGLLTYLRKEGLTLKEVIQ